MKLVMINDCAYVGETLIKYMPSEIKAVHLKRSRKLWDKTFGITWRILRAEADVFHVHYLLQDCYLALRLGKRPVVGHAHGSDLRSTLTHRVWGRIVRHNLKNCQKVLVSTPDVLGQARQFREDAEYLPNPVDEGLFYNKPAIDHDGKKRVLIASDSNWAVKGTDLALRALAKIKEDVDVSVIKHGVDFDRTLSLASSLGLPITVLPKVLHDRMNEYYWAADVVIDRFTLGSLGMVSLEAIACGRPAVAYVSSDFAENELFPLKDVRGEKEIAEVIGNSSKLWEREHAFVVKYHSVEAVVSRLTSLYKALL